MRHLVRTVAAIVVVLASVFAPPRAAAGPADDALHGCASDGGRGAGECQHFLRNPAGPTDDPCWCDKCRNGGPGDRHDGKTVPWNWNDTLFASGGTDAYLKRHSVAFGIVCSECLASDKPWPDGAANFAGTIPEKDFAGRPAKETVLARLDAERRNFRKPEDVVVAYTQRIYLVTDVGPIKVRTPGGSSRMASRHEWLHLMIERAEFARREWVRHLGEPIVMRKSAQRPVAIYVPDRFRDFERIGATLFRQAGSRGLRGPVAELCDGMCLGGMAFSREEGGDDAGCVTQLRHDLSHALLSMWGSLEVRPKSLPVWLDEGLAHWLVKNRRPDDVFYCAPEGLGGPSAGSGGPAWPGKDWEKDVARYVQSGKLGPVESLLGKTAIGEMTEEDQKRAWSLLDHALADVREPFAKVLAGLRREENPRDLFQKHLGCTPETFDQRWRDRVLGKRTTLAATPADADAAAGDTPGARDRRALREEKDPKVLAAKLRALGEIRDAATVGAVLDAVAQDSDLVRETALVTLLAVKDPACRDAIRTAGLGHADAIVRATAARVCGRLRLESALPDLAKALDDRNWLVRAEAAVACGAMKDLRALPALRKLVVSDPSEKARVGAMDALAAYGDEAAMAVPLIAKSLDAPQWQLRVAAAQTLGVLGSMEAVEPLVAAMEKEPAGRVSDDIRAALAKIVRDDLGRRAENWRKWWDREKANAPGGMPKRPSAPAAAKPPAADPGSTSAETPKYFGVEIFSNRVGFVCDVSESMNEFFTPDPAAAKSLGRTYTGSTKLAICKEEVTQALGALDPRSYVSLVCFGTQVRAFRPAPVPASGANVADAKSWVRALVPQGETNYYDALRLALDAGGRPDANPDFRSTPDTITFLTDGEPTKGDILDAEVLVEWYTGLNRYARVKTNTITFGRINVDVHLLEEIATRNGGRFVLVPEAPVGTK